MGRGGPSHTLCIALSIRTPIHIITLESSCAMYCELDLLKIVQLDESEES